MKEIDRELILSKLQYNRELGSFTWLQDQGGTSSGGAGGLSNNFWRIGIQGSMIPEQYLVWVVETGEWPDRYIEHIDGDYFNNQFSNLKLTEEVYWSAIDRNGKWLAQITPTERWITLGVYDTAIEALQACKEGMKKYYHKFTRKDT